MSDGRIYSDEEFALILRKAAELGRNAESPATATGGLTLTEMKSAAAQAGLDPVLVERAARMHRDTITASPIERLAGGPLRHSHETRFHVTLDEAGASRLLSAVRIAVGVAGARDVGHSSAMGMTWHDGAELESLGVTARPEGGGTDVSITVDRRATLALVAVVSTIATFFALLFAGSALYPESHALGVGGAIVGVGGILAAARGYWASSTKRVRERIGQAMNVIEKTLHHPEG
jgi:hypothetical protein